MHRSSFVFLFEVFILSLSLLLDAGFVFADETPAPELPYTYILSDLSNPVNEAISATTATT